MIMSQQIDRNEIEFQEYERMINMSLTKNGISTTTQNDQFQYEKFTSRIGRKPVTRIQWDYRDKSGELHAGIATSIDLAMQAASKFGYEIPFVS